MTTTNNVKSDSDETQKNKKSTVSTEDDVIVQLQLFGRLW
jgi:hypothetical protein